MSLYTYRVIQATVIDGDTLDLVIDLGFRITQQIRVRLEGINCPEMNTPEGKAAKQFAVEWVANRLMIAKTIKDKKEKYGRYRVVITAGESELNTELVEAGHAAYKDY